MSEQQIESQEIEVTDDELATLPAERLAAMLRDKRKAEATVRGKLRDAEAQRDALVGTVSGFQKEALNGVAKTAGVLPSALSDLALHVPLESVLGEGGLLDTEKATAALTELKVSKPHFFPASVGASGTNFAGGSGEIYGGGEASWGDVLK
jgi:hypothetical protein